MRTANALSLDTVSALDGTVTVRLPEAGRFHVHIQVSWEPVVPDRKAIFDEVRRRADPDALAVLEQLGEDSIANPAGLLEWGAIDDPTFERPPQPVLGEREPVE